MFTEFLPQDIDPFGLVVFGALGAISIVATMTAIYKILQFILLGVGRHKAARTLLDRWLAGDGSGAFAHAKKRNTVTVRVLFAALSGLKAEPNNRSYAEELATQAALSELAQMSRWMRILESVVQAAPMLGLLGTVIGMIEAFRGLAESTGGVDPTVLAGGIYTALTTTAVGLSIAVVFYFISIWLEGRIDRERNTLTTMISAVVYGRAEMQD